MEIIEEARTKYKYYYKGPVYHFDNVLTNNWQAYTMAVSREQALNNLKIQAKKEFNFSLDSRIELNDNDITIIDDDDFLPRCPECGELLSDNGECPYCKEGERHEI